MTRLVVTLFVFPVLVACEDTSPNGRWTFDPSAVRVHSGSGRDPANEYADRRFSEQRYAEEHNGRAPSNPAPPPP